MPSGYPENMWPQLQSYVQLILISLFFPILIGAILIRSRRSKSDGPPTPPSLPLIGHLHLLSPLPHRSFHNLSSRYGPILKLFLGSLPCVIASTPDAAKHFLKTHESSFSDRFPNAAIHHLSYGSQGFLFRAYGPHWKFMKKLCMTRLLEAREVVDNRDNPLTLTNRIISRMIMSRTSSGNDEEAQDIRQLVTDTTELRFNLRGVDKRVKEIQERFDALIEGVMKGHEEERRKRKEVGEGGQFRDLLYILLDIHEDENSKIKLTKHSIKAFVLDLFMAGTDTSAITTEWALAELINHPHVMEKARQEIESVIGNTRIVEESDIANLPYLQAIVKETLRIHPTAPLVGRLSNENCNVGGYEIPAKTLLFVNLWSIGRDPNYWEDPLEFRPERFMSEEGSRVDLRGQHFELISFGSGRRMCPGASLALLVVQTNLAAMIQCFDWKVNGGNQCVSMEEKPAMTLPRAHPLLCLPLPRLHPFPSTFQAD
ncbi:3,9-dihydroxypterocarpan 6A-monooxygenase-like [Senna tora]|uniref:3,9-dihydroxypterocarpan 6A-monooxygenase-like n=1 Tax=Senna tora TaxID=362788 RepID=A0A834SKF8_9FABA|nr:3,9-dihydroxypterocarpan 6A-monooxygenase-like [Senna tora]